MSCSKSRGCLLTLVALFLLTGSACQAAVISVEQFLAKKKNWANMTGRTLKIEGRVSTMNERILIFRKVSGITFRAREDLPKGRRERVCAEVTGQIFQDAETGFLLFDVHRIKVLPNDQDRLDRLRIDLPRNDPEPWYELARWALGRAEFYDDPKHDTELRQSAMGLIESAIRRERNMLEFRDYPNLQKLHRKARGHGVSQELLLSILHEAHYTEWRNKRKSSSGEELFGLASAVASELPGAETPTEENADLLKLRKDYLESPKQVYDEETQIETRRKLHRVLYREIILDGIDQLEEPTGKNGAKIAKLVEQYLPEEKSLAESYYAKERNWRLSQVASFRRREMLELREEFQKLGQEDKADQALERWFREREKLLRDEGADGLVELAAEYDDLLNDPHRAIDILLEAYRANSGLGLIQDRLEAYGYKLIDGEWKGPREIEELMNTPINRAMREGRVIPRMTNTQVVKTLGRPDSVTRILTAKNVIEYWVYGQAPSRTSIRMYRPRHRRVSYVMSVNQLNR